MAIAGSGGIQIHDLERELQHLSLNPTTSDGGAGSPRTSRRRHAEENVTHIALKDQSDEVTRCINFLPPNSHGAHLLCATT